MNERIKELYRQVGLDFENFLRVTITEDDLERFAELIILEACNVVEGEDSYYGGWAREVIKKHFRVEE